MIALRTPRPGRPGLVALAPLLAGALVLAPSAARARPEVPDGFATRVVATGLADAVDLEFASDGRLFVAERSGRVRVLRSDGRLTTFLNLGRAVDRSGGRGLSGIAFDPDFATNHFVYLDYTRKAGAGRAAHNEVVRVTARGNRAVPDSLRVLFRLDGQATPHHLGGALEFGGDGLLYVTSGDNETPARARRLDSHLGKILRISRTGRIPASNPFYDRASGRHRAIWARGLRNPYKLSYSPALGAMFVTDVGEDRWEEIDRVERGADYGWPLREGPGVVRRLAAPVFAYRHGSSPTTGCAITGGVFYEPATSTFPAAYAGDYFYADYCSGWIRRYDPVADTSARFASGFAAQGLTDLEVSPDGDLYALRWGRSSVVTRISHTG